MSLCLTSPIVSHSFDTLLNTFFFSFSSSCRLSPLISLLLSISSYLYLLFYSTFPPLCLSPFYFPLYLSLSLSLSIPLSISLSLSLPLPLSSLFPSQSLSVCLILLPPPYSIFSLPFFPRLISHTILPPLYLFFSTPLLSIDHFYISTLI